MLRSVRSLLVAVAAVAVLATSATAQEMTTSDVQRLQQTADQIGDELVNLRSRDRVAARTAQTELTELEEEITYLKVRLRREHTVPRAHFVDVRDRLEDLRSRVIGGEGSTGRSPNVTLWGTLQVAGEHSSSTCAIRAFVPKSSYESGWRYRGTTGRPSTSSVTA